MATVEYGAPTGGAGTVTVEYGAPSGITIGGSTGSAVVEYGAATGSTLGAAIDDNGAWLWTGGAHRPFVMWIDVPD